MQGSVSRGAVIHVLHHCGVALIVHDESTILLIDGDTPEVYVLPENVPRRMLHRFSHKYGVNIEYFYHPEKCPKT